MTPLFVMLIGLVIVAFVILREIALGMSSMGGGDGDGWGAFAVFAVGVAMFLGGFAAMVWQWIA